MKNQYVSDINDYWKYGLIRVLAQQDADALRTGIFWMLTPDDSRNDGNKLHHFKYPEQFRQYDEPLFVELERIRKEEKRHVGLVATSKSIFSNATFCDDLIPDQNAEARKRIFAKALEKFKDRDLIFFDPDNGLEPQTTQLGEKGSSKYLYLTEVADAYKQQQSLLIYQHFARKAWDTYIPCRARELMRCSGSKRAFSFQVQHVCFFLLPQQSAIPCFESRIKSLKQKWQDRFVCREHHADGGNAKMSFKSNKMEAMLLALLGASEIEHGIVCDGWERSILQGLHEQGLLENKPRNNGPIRLTTSGLLLAKKLAEENLV